LSRLQSINNPNPLFDQFVKLVELRKSKTQNLLTQFGAIFFYAWTSESKRKIQLWINVYNDVESESL